MGLAGAGRPHLDPRGVEGWRRRRDGDRSHRIVTGVFTYVALGEDRRPRPINEPGPGG